MRYFDENIWTVVSESPFVISYSVKNTKFFDLRMLAIRLRDKKLLVYSPIADVPEDCLKKLEDHGTVGYLLAPNYFHNLGIPVFKKKYPDSILVAQRNAIPRLTRITGHDFQDIDSITRLLPENVCVIIPPALKTGEAWLQIKSENGSGILVVCDAFFNMHSHHSGIFGLVLRIAGTSPGIKISRVFRYLAVQNRGQYFGWLRNFFEIQRVTTIIPSHGDEIKADELRSTVF